MSIQNIYDGAQLMCRTLRALDEAKLSVIVGDDMAEYARMVAEERQEQPLGPPFDPALHDLTGGRAFWVAARNADGDLVHTQTMRLIDLAGHSLADYLRRNFREYPPPGLPIDMENSAYNAGPGARRMFGRVAYHGELWIKDNAALRGSGLLDYLSRFAFLSASMHWQPDYIFGFMARGTARRGVAERIGYMHSDPFALTWKVDGRNQPIIGNLVYMAQDDIHYVTHVPLDEVSAA